MRIACGEIFAPEQVLHNRQVAFGGELDLKGVGAAPSRRRSGLTAGAPFVMERDGDGNVRSVSERSIS